MIIDAHAHAWPNSVAAKALSAGVSSMELFGDGTIAGLRQSMAESGIDRTAVLAVANTPEKVDTANAFVGSVDRELFIPFGSVHPGLDIETNLASLRAHGMRAAKLHPLFQNFRLDDPALIALLDAMSGEFAVTIHTGTGAGHSGDQCTPALLAQLSRELPNLDIIACHLGGYQLLDDADDEVIGLPVYLDTSWPPGLSTVDPQRVRDMIERHGPNRVIFASDWPTADPKRELEAIYALRLAEDDTAAVLGGNLERLLQLS
ncbi:MAG: amidohydrolase family protein [Acidimicrobiia bacterium]